MTIDIGRQKTRRQTQWFPVGLCTDSEDISGNGDCGDPHGHPTQTTGKKTKTRQLRLIQECTFFFAPLDITENTLSYPGLAVIFFLGEQRLVTQVLALG